MTQKFYLRDVVANQTPTAGEKSTALPVHVLQANNATGTQETRSLRAEKGTAQTSIAQTSDATTSARDGYHARFTSNPLVAGTYGSGTWVHAMACSKSNANANFRLTASIYFWRPSTNAVVGFVYDADTLIGTEPPVSETGEVNNITGVNVTIIAGDVLVLELWRHQAQGNATARTNTYFFNGTVDPTDGTGTSDAAAYLQAPANIPELQTTVATRLYHYKQYEPTWINKRKIKKSGRRTTKRFDAWKAIFPVVTVVNRFIHKTEYISITPKKHFWSPRLWRAIFTPTPVVGAPDISYNWSFYQRYLSEWNRKRKLEKSRNKLTPEYNTWESLIRLLKIQKVKPRPHIVKREPINAPNPKYSVWENLIRLLKGVAPTQQRRQWIVKRKPFVTTTPKFDAWQKILDAITIPVIRYTQSLYYRYLPTWRDKRKLEKTRVKPTPDYDVWFNLIRLLRIQKVKPKPLIVKREPINRPTPQYALWANLLRILRKEIRKPLKVVVKREPIIRPNPRYTVWQFLFNIRKNIRKTKPFIVKREPVLRPSPRFTAWKAIFPVVGITVAEIMAALRPIKPLIKDKLNRIKATTLRYDLWSRDIPNIIAKMWGGGIRPAWKQPIKSPWDASKKEWKQRSFWKKNRNKPD